jgi:Gpi18-like mannosyltransferase
MWGQVDSMYMFFCFGAMVFVIVKKPYWAIAAFAFSLMMKPQAVFLAPLLLVLYSGWLLEAKIRILKSAIVFLFSIFLIAAPFILHGQGMNLIEITFGAIDRVPAVSMHAFNCWHLFFPGQDLVWMPDSNLYLGLSLRSWGMLMFFITLVFTLRPFLKYFKTSVFDSKEELLKMGPLLLLGAATVNLVFFYFNTQMHERYIHAAILLVGTASIINRNYLTYILLSLAYFLSQDILMHHCRFPEVIYRAPLPYHPIFISLLFLTTLILLWKELKCYSRPLPHSIKGQ